MHIFDEDIVSAVLKHMNTDHPEDNILIVRAFASVDVTSATMTGLDGNGGSWAFTTPSNQARQSLVVPWSGPINERAEIRREVVVLYTKACAILGVQPRD